MTPVTEAYQDPLPMGFSRQEYRSGLPLPSPVLTISVNKIDELIELKDGLANATVSTGR